jgi:hypothetical protein
MGVTGKTSKKGYTKLPDNPEKFRFMISVMPDRQTHFNLFDKSCVDYFPNDKTGVFDIKFDSKLYEAPL